MDCSYCCKPLRYGEDDPPNVHVENVQQQTFLSLHPECVKEVQNGLALCHSLVVN